MATARVELNQRNLFDGDIPDFSSLLVQTNATGQKHRFRLWFDPRDGLSLEVDREIVLRMSPERLDSSKP